VRRMAPTGVILRLCALCFAFAPASPPDEIRSVNDIRKEVVEKQSAQPQPGRAIPRLELKVAAPNPVPCPSPSAVNFFRHEIAYERTEELDPLKGLGVIHAHVWDRGPLTAFYVDEPLRTFPPSLRLAYLVGADGARGSFSCPVEQDWRKCVEDAARLEAANNLVRTCTTTIDLRTIPAWEPSPNDPEKRRVTDELRREIEARWPMAQEIVIRDFNLSDRQITIYLKLPDGEYFQGCGFRAMREPHCQGWHLFGQAPVSRIRSWILEKPYRLR
jgi:hypothetical protein